MNRTLVFLTFALLPLAGCFGVPDDAVGRGDVVQGTLVVWDAETGDLALSAFDLVPTEENNGTTGWTPDTIRQAFAARGGMPAGLDALLAGKDFISEAEARNFVKAWSLGHQLAIPVQFTAGTGDGGFGAALERVTIGAKQGSIVEGTLRDSGLAFEGEVSREAIFGPVPLEGQLETSRFVGAFGEIADGERFTPPGSFYEYEKISQDDTFVTYKVIPMDGQRDPVPNVGSVLITYVDVEDESMTQVLEPQLGATFVVQPPTPFNPNTPLELDPGSYKVLEGSEGMMHVAFAETQYPSLVDRPLQYRFTIDAIQKSEATAVEPVDGNYGVRTSPQLHGTPDSEPFFGAWADRP